MHITSWDEKPYREWPDGRKVARADVALSRPDGDDEGLEGTFDSVLYYRADGTSTFTGQLVASGVLDGRAGDFVLAGTGTYDGQQASMRLDIIEGSGTSDLAGISGYADSVSTHADYPYMPLTLTYDLE
jgi:hypothetical protein